MEPEAPAPTATAAPVDPPTTATDPQTTGADAATQKKKRAKKRFVFPKGINMKKYFARKPGKARRQYVEGFRQREKAKLKPPKEKVVQPIVSRPWVTPEMDEAAQVLAAEKEKLEEKPQKPKVKNGHVWPKGFNPCVYAKMGAEERYEYVNKLREQQGLDPTPRTKVPVPNKFALPDGMDLEQFLSRSPGPERMRYLARYIRRHKIDLEATRVRRKKKARVPLGRKPEPRSHPRCGCSSSEACASCSRCMELHCVCGLPGRQRRALCQESRACSCILFDPTARCKLCHGCRQPQGFSHCRCVLHQKVLWTKRHPELETELTEEEEDAACNCFVLANRHGGASATKKKEEKTLEEIQRVRRIKRGTGFPSSDNIYRIKKISTFLGDEGLEDDLDDGVDDGVGTETLPPSTESVLPRTMIRKLVDPVYNPATYHPLNRSEGCSLLEAIEPRSGYITRRNNAAFSSDAMMHEICRGLDNFAYEIDRNATMPPDDLVDFFVYMASIKASNVGELIGTFEDSAAVAASIVIEEYMAQLVEDSAMQQQALCPPTKTTVQAFARELLIGFNWRLFQAYFPLDTVDKIDTLLETITAMIFDEFVSIQPRDFDTEAYRSDLEEWIRSAISVPFFTSTGAIRRGPNVDAARSTSKQSDGAAQATSRQSARVTRNISKQSVEVARTTSKRSTGNVQGQTEERSDGVGAAHSSPHIRLSVKANTLHGNPAYKLYFTTTLTDGHCIKASVGELDSKVKANATIAQLSKTLEHHDKKRKGMLRIPCPPPPVPGPQPSPRPLPPRDPNDPHDSLFALVCEHFNLYRQRRWESAVAKYSSWKIATAQGLEWVPERKQRKRSMSVESLHDGDEKKRRMD